MAEYTIDKIEYDGNTYNLSPNVVYATCSTAASTAAKVATITSGTLASLNTGDQVIVKFTYANGKASPTLKVGSTDAKSIMRYGTTAPSTSAATSWNAGSCVWFVYDGTYWQMAGWINTTYSEISEANITSGTGSTTGLVSGRRAKAAVGAFESITDVTVGGTTVVSGRVAAIPAIPTVPSNIVNTITTTAGTHTTITNQTGSVSFNVPTKTSHLTNDSGFITNAGVTSITTTAGAHTAITSATGAVSFKVPTTAAHVGAAASDHTHGNITNGGDITATAPTIASGDQIIINDHSASKITNGPTFDGSTTTTALTPKGTWETFSKFSGSYNDLTNKPTIPTLPSNIVNTITTTEGAHTTITSQKNDVSFKVPTKTSHLTNDSGFITSYTDEKLKWTASTSTNTYYPLVSTSTATTSTANTLNGISFYQYYNTAGGYRRLELGNTTANQSTGGAYGAIRLFGANATYYGDLVPGNPELGSSISGAGLSANRTWKLPDKSGTIALTSDVIPKPPDDGAYGWVLKYLNTNSAFWDVPSGYRFTIREDENNPGTYAFEGDEPVNIQNALFSGTSLILELDLLNADIYDIYTLTDYYTQEISTNDGCYYVLWFTGIFRKTGTSHKKITVGIYLDELEVEHEYGEIAVTIDAVASAGTDGSEGMTIGDWKICWGSVSLNTASASGSGTYASPYYVSSSTISLNYTALPYIWCQVLGEWTGTRYATPYDTSETGFKIRLYASAKNSTSTSIRWLAIGKA